VGPSRRGLAALLVVVLGLSGGLIACVPNAKAGVVSPTTPGEATIRYGPFRIPAATQGRMGMIRNNFAFDVQRPCTNCYITSMQAGLVTPDGRSANVDRGLWLHHMVMFDTSKTDVTCPGLGVGALGQRFFSSGNERTPVNAGGNFGFHQGANYLGAQPTWTLIYDLANLNPTAQDVSITVKFTWAPLTTPGMRPITPVWLDINQCLTSEMPNRPGEKFQYSYSVVSQRAGRLIGIGGHIHDGGINLAITKNSQIICDSRAKYGETPEYIEGPTSLGMPGMAHISSMSRCQGTYEQPVTQINIGDRIGITSYYDMTGDHSHGDMQPHPVMGIAIGYMVEG
jgi:hypothetical protein